MLKIYAKIREIEYNNIKEILLSLADRDLIGKEIKHNGVIIKISEDFYKGKLVTKKEASLLMRKATIINFIGKESVELGVKNGYLIRENIICLGKEKVPHGQYVKI